MPRSERLIGSVLAQQKRTGRARLVLAFLLLAIILASAFHSGLLDPRRLADGVPAIWQLATEMVPPNFTRWSEWWLPLLDTVAMSIAGTALAVILSVPLGLLAARSTTPNVAVYRLARMVLNVLRSIPELIMAIMFVAAVGFGALPGVLALGIHSVGMVAKFFAEAVEHVVERLGQHLHFLGLRAVGVHPGSQVPPVDAGGDPGDLTQWRGNVRSGEVGSKQGEHEHGAPGEQEGGGDAALRALDRAQRFARADGDAHPGQRAAPDVDSDVARVGQVVDGEPGTGGEEPSPHHVLRRLLGRVLAALRALRRQDLEMVADRRLAGHDGEEQP